MATLDGQPYNAGINKVPEKKVEKQKRIVLYGTDALLKTLVIIYHGKKGEQHQIIQFRDDHCIEKNSKGP